MADRPLKTPKVFGIGFQKTGTTTLRDVLLTFGYRVKGGGSEMVPQLARGDLSPAYEMANRYDGFEDHPWPNLFKEMDAHFPGSKFILTVRDEASWIASAVNHLGCLPSRSQKFTYGYSFPAGFEDIYLTRYRAHNDEVRAYFRDRPDDLLEVNFAETPRWEEICAFLGEPVPDTPFPHQNRGSYTPGKRKIWAVAGAVIGTLRGVPPRKRKPAPQQST